MRELFSNLSSSVTQRFNEIQQQNSDVQTSINFMSDKYDALLLKMQTMEDERSKDKKTISVLEEKIEFLERKIKSTSIEIRNTPRLLPHASRAETKQELSDLAINMAKSIDVNLQESDIRDIYRINSSKEASKPIVLELNSVIKKESLIQSVKAFNKSKPKGSKLNSNHLNIPGKPTPVFVSELLTFKTQKIFFLSREFARNNEYQHCWTSKGVVHLRKADGKTLIRINSEADLDNLKKHII